MKWLMMIMNIFQIIKKKKDENKLDFGNDESAKNNAGNAIN